jgi:hypothetical protein
LLLALLSPSCNLLHHQELARASSGAQKFNPSSFSKKKKKMVFFVLSFAGILSSSTKLLQLLLQIPTKLPNETKTQNNKNNKKA